MAEQKEKVKKILERFDKMRGKRAIWEDHWQTLADYYIPNKNNIWRVDFPGTRKFSHLFDSTGMHAAELLGGALHGMLTSPNLLWFELTTGEPELDKRDDVRIWMDKTRVKMHETFNQSNFQEQIHEIYLDMVIFGTACLFMEEDEELLVRFKAIPIKEFFIEENARGLVDTVYREFDMTGKQILEKFGDSDAIDAECKRFLEAKRDEDHKICHAVYPRSEYNDKSLNPKDYPVGSCYILKEKGKELSESGFKEFPFAVPRWSKVSGETYGRSPAMTALPDVRMVNEMMKVTLKGAQKVVDPPIMLPDDGFVLPVKLTPGGVNYYRAGSADRIEPFANDARIDFGQQVMEDVRMRIKQAFFVDQLKLIENRPEMTATEVLQRSEENLRLLGPMTGRQNNELLRVLIDRTFAMHLRANALPPIPEVLSGKKVDVRYSSMVAKAQRVSEIQNITRTLEVAAPFIQADPAVRDNLNGDEALRYVAKSFGAPQEILNSLDRVNEIRQSRAEAQQELAEQQRQQAEADVADTAASAVSQVASV